MKCYIMPHFMATHQVLGEISTLFTLQLNTKMSPLALHFSTLHCFNLVSSSLQSSKRWIYFFVIASVTSIKALCVYLEYVYIDKHNLTSDYMVSQLRKYVIPEAKTIPFCFWEKETKLQGNWNTVLYDIKRRRQNFTKFNKSPGNTQLPLVFPLAHMQMRSCHKQRLHKPRNYIENLALDSSRNMLLTLLLLLSRHAWNFHCKTLFPCTLP